MSKFQSALTLDGHHYKAEELTVFCQLQLAIPDLPAWRKELYLFILDWLSETDYVIMHTSGSTGSPKEINHLKSQMIHSALMTQAYFKFDPSTNALLALPASYIAGKMMVVRAFVSGMNLIVVEPSANPFLTVDDRIDFVAITPYQLGHSLNELKTWTHGSILVGGVEIPLALEKDCQSLSATVYASYGMTETSSHIALRAVNGLAKSAYYTVLNGVEVSLDRRGCLVIQAPGLITEPLVTNDLVVLVDPSHFEWIGRFDQVINSGGVKIFPEVVERKLAPFISDRFFITALPDPLLGEKVTLFVESKIIDAQLFDSIFQTSLSKYEVPREIIPLPHFELSSTGKILKNQIVINYLQRG